MNDALKAVRAYRGQCTMMADRCRDDNPDKKAWEVAARAALEIEHAINGGRIGIPLLTMTAADKLRAQMPTSTDPARLEREAQRIERRDDMNNFKPYRRSQIAYLRRYEPGETLSERVSISAADIQAGSPKEGDMIARNPKNPDDQWLVAAAYFADNFEPMEK